MTNNEWKEDWLADSNENHGEDWCVGICAGVVMDSRNKS